MSSRLNPRDYDLGELREAVREMTRQPGADGRGDASNDPPAGEPAYDAADRNDLERVVDDRAGGRDVDGPEAALEPGDDDEPRDTESGVGESLESGVDSTGESDGTTRRDRRVSHLRWSASRANAGSSSDDGSSAVDSAPSDDGDSTCEGHAAVDGGALEDAVPAPGDRPTWGSAGDRGPDPASDEADTAGGSPTDGDLGCGAEPGTADGDRDPPGSLPREEFELLSRLSRDVRRPYLRRLPDGYAGQLAVLEWLEWLVSAAGPEATREALAHYESVGWISGESRSTLETIVEGLESASPPEPRALDARDHRESLLHVARLAARAEA